MDTVDGDLVGGYVRVTGRDQAAQLLQMKVSEKWQNQPGSSIVSRLAGMAGLGAVTNSIGLMAGKKLQQDFVKLADNVPAGYVINKLAEFDGAKWYVNNGQLFYSTLGTTMVLTPLTGPQVPECSPTPFAECAL